MHAYDRFLPEWFNRVREAAGQRLAQPYDGRTAADPLRGGVRVLITGPPGFERTVANRSPRSAQSASHAPARAGG
jgi:hypothetical protein